VAAKDAGRMGALTYVLDSTLLIDAANRIPSARDFLLEHHAASAISPVTRAEMLAGVEAKHAAAYAKWLSTFHYLPLDEPCADLAAGLRREHRWKLPDAFQAAVALRNGLRLVTRNTKDFPPAKHAFVFVPYQV
jgi:predicted nucleic acid-binding protein